MILLKNKDKKANIKIGNNIEIKDGSDFPFDLTLHGRSTQATSTNPVMPSPDYPSPIESVGRKNIITSLNTKQNNYINYNLDNSLIKKTMTFSCIIDTSITSANLYIIPATGVSAISLGTINFTANQRTTKTFNLTDEQIQAIKSNQGGIFQIYKSSAFESANITDVQLEKGTVVTDYVPYEHTEISATVTGKNLFDGTGWRTVQSGSGFPTPSTGATIVSSDKNNISFTSTQWAYAGVESGFIKVKANETYMFSAKFITPTNRFFITQYDENKTRMSTLNNVTSLKNTTFTTTNDGYITIAFTNTTTAQTTYKIENIQLEKGTQATPYEEYKSNSLTINLQGNELCSLPNGTKDELVVENGEALLIKRVGKVVLDGSENWAEYVSQTSDGYRVYTTAYRLGLTGTLSYDTFLSNYFQAIPFEQKNSINLTKYATYLNIDNTIANTVAGVKAWLSTHNTEVLYELAEPETINLGTVEMPHTYNGVSNITNSADTEMVVKYYKKFEFDKILRSGYNIDEQEYEIAKKQMANGKRKKILSSYVDCIIKIDLGLLDNKTYQEYKEQLEDGEYEYWSYKYNQYKKANFILTKPSITTEYAYDDDIGIDDMEITLEKSSDVS